MEDLIMDKESEVLWDELIERYRKSGLGLKRFCKENDISYNRMKYVLYGKSTSSKPKMETKEKEDNKVELVPVSIVDNVFPNKPITIAIHGATIDVDHCTDLELLRKLIYALSQ